LGHASSSEEADEERQHENANATEDPFPVADDEIVNHFHALSARVGHQGFRSTDPLIKSQLHGIRKPLDDKDLRPAQDTRAAHLQRADRNAPQSAELPPDLAQVVTAWRRLPEAVKTGIMAMVAASRRR
jgi:hypothetical protein